MESRPSHTNMFDEGVQETGEVPTGSYHSFTRQNRGMRRQITDEEAKKIDDDFWNNNPLFSGEKKRRSEVSDSAEKQNGHGKKSASQDGDDHNEEDNEDDDDEDDEDEDYEGMEEEDDSDGDMVIEDNESVSKEDEKSEKEKAGQEEDENKMQEEEKEDLAMIQLYKKNQASHFFFRPIFFKADIEELGKQDRSYVVLPEELILPEGKTDLAKQCINRNYIGVPPKAPEEFQTGTRFPSEYEYEMFKYEDERYTLDLNIQRYKRAVKILQEIVATEDLEQKQNKLTSLFRSAKMVRQKYEIDDSETESEKIQNVLNEVTHDLENLYKRRAHSDLVTKTKKQIRYPLAVRDKEIKYAASEKENGSNSKLINDMCKNLKHVPLKSLSDSPSEGLVSYEAFFNLYKKIFFKDELHQVLFQNPEFFEVFDKRIQELFVSYRASPYSILPTSMLFITNQNMFTETIQLLRYFIKKSPSLDSETLTSRLHSLVFDLLGFEVGNEVRLFDIDSQQFFETSEDIIDYRHFKVEDFLPSAIAAKNSVRNVPVLPTPSPDFHLNPTQPSATHAKDFKLFVPSSQSEEGQAPKKFTFGTHFSYFVMKYIYTIYLKLLLASQPNETGDSEHKFDLYMNLTAAYTRDKLETAAYELSVINIFGEKAKYLLNLKYLLQKTSRALLNLFIDDLSKEVFEGVLIEQAKNPSEEELFTFVCEHINNNEKIKDAENHVYRFHLDPSQGWFSTSIVDIQGIFMRVVKTQTSDVFSTEKNIPGEPKKIQIKRDLNPQPTSVLGKRQLEEDIEATDLTQEENDPEPVKKVHLA